MSDEFKNLEVWKLSKEMVKLVYQTCQNFPKEEVFGLLSQIKRSAISIPSNIAEGSNRRSAKDFIRFINIATGSLAELETQLIIAHELTFIEEKELIAISDMIKRIGQMLTKLRKSLETNDERLTINDKR